MTFVWPPDMQPGDWHVAIFLMSVTVIWFLCVGLRKKHQPRVTDNPGSAGSPARTRPHQPVDAGSHAEALQAAAK